MAFAQQDAPSDGTDRRIEQWQPLDPPFSVRGSPSGGGQSGHGTVAEAFRGEFNQKVDAKARVLIPVTFRRVLEAGDGAANRPRLVMVYGDPRRQFVECYTVEEMATLESRILLLPAGSPQRRLLERNYITLSATIEVDEDGRIVLPPKVREKLGLSADEIKGTVEAVFAGTLNTFQIWKRDLFEADLAAKEAEEAALLEGGIDMLTLLPQG